MLDGLDEEPWVYFVHSYAPVPAESSAASVIATCHYGGEVVAAVESGTLWGTQFHPEKSGDAGAVLLANWLETLR